MGPGIDRTEGGHLDRDVERSGDTSHGDLKATRQEELHETSLCCRVGHEEAAELGDGDASRSRACIAAVSPSIPPNSYSCLQILTLRPLVAESPGSGLGHSVANLGYHLDYRNWGAAAVALFSSIFSVKLICECGVSGLRFAVFEAVSHCFFPLSVGGIAVRGVFEPSSDFSGKFWQFWEVISNSFLSEKFRRDKN